MRITQQSVHNSLNLQSLVKLEINWQATALAALFLLMSVLPSTAQFALEDPAPEPHPAFAAEQSWSKASETYKDALTDYEALRAARAAITQTQATYSKFVDIMIENETSNTGDRPIPIPAGAVEAMEAYVQAQVQLEQAIDRYELSQAEYENASKQLSQYLDGLIAKAEAAIATLTKDVSELEDELALTNDYTSELNDRLEALEQDRTLYLTVHNWCVHNADTSLCRALGFPE